MSSCCPHPDADHQVVGTCQKVIHYPSEDYPCLCSGFSGAGETCERCEHDRSQHSRARVCKPASGEFCACRTAL